jgi:hypothetical protein
MEAIVCDANGLAVFDLLRRRWHEDVILCAFDLLELARRDIRRHLSLYPPTAPGYAEPGYPP